MILGGDVFVQGVPNHGESLKSQCKVSLERKYTKGLLEKNRGKKRFF